MGYDALVVRMTNSSKEKGGGGPLTYLLNLLKGLFRYNHAFLNIEVDGESIYKAGFQHECRYLQVQRGAWCSCRTLFPTTPFRCDIFKNVTKMTVLRHIKKLYSGNFTHLPLFRPTAGKTSHNFTTNETSNLETDGESLGHSPFTFQIVPKSVKVITARSGWTADEIIYLWI